jgi:hypothetical protein
MADVWFYAQDGQQAGPVSAAQLQQLVRTGRLQATDLVWREGLPQWIQAHSVTGLFAPQELPAPIPFAPEDRPPEKDYGPDDRARRRPRPRDDDWDEDDERPRRRRPRDDWDDDEDFRPRRRRRRKAAGGWEGMPTGAKVGLIVGGLVLVVLAVAVPVMLFTANRGPDDGDRNFNGRLGWTDPMDRVRFGCRSRTYSYRMKAGTHYTIRMHTNTPGFDPYLRLENPSGAQVAEDDDGDGFPNARIEFQCPQDGVYRIVATSFAPNMSGNFQILVTRPPPLGGR